MKLTVSYDSYIVMATDLTTPLNNAYQGGHFIILEEFNGSIGLHGL
ncbi:hypothetical protein PaeBR_06425 [Paenibacillus sp. BR2-3]